MAEIPVVPRQTEQGVHFDILLQPGKDTWPKDNVSVYIDEYLAGFPDQNYDHHHERPFRDKAPEEL